MGVVDADRQAAVVNPQVGVAGSDNSGNLQEI